MAGELDGSKVKIWVLAVQDGAAAPANVAAMEQLCGISGISQDYTRQALDKTAFCSDGVKEFLSGLREDVASLDGNFIPTDLGQIEIEAARAGDGDAQVQLVVAYTGDPADGTLLLPLIIESRNISAAVDTLVTISYGLKVSGSITAGPTT